MDKFRECGKLHSGRKLSLKMKRIYGGHVKSAMLYGNQTWCGREDQMVILKTIENVVCGVKLNAKRNSLELMDLRVQKKL